MNEDELRGIKRSKAFVKYGRAYFDMQGTTPYTLGAVLAASPISTIAYLCNLPHFRRACQLSAPQR